MTLVEREFQLLISEEAWMTRLEPVGPENCSLKPLLTMPVWVVTAVTVGVRPTVHGAFVVRRPPKRPTVEDEKV